jgi:hypothetical protein
VVELAASIEPVQDGRFHIEKINAPFLYTPQGQRLGVRHPDQIRCPARQLKLQESGPYVCLKTDGPALILKETTS